MGAGSCPRKGRHRREHSSSRRRLRAADATLAAVLAATCTVAGWRRRGCSPAACTLPARRAAALLSAAAPILSSGIPSRASSTVQFKEVIAESGLEDWQVRDYEAMRDDAPRTSSFAAAIQQRLSEKRGTATVVDIGTGPFALLAVIAAKAGARRVFAVEKNIEAAAAARETVAKAGLGDTIQVIEGDSMKVELPEKADLIVSELIGSIAAQEGVQPIIRDARQRFLKEDIPPAEGMIPLRCQTCIAPILYRGRSLFAKLTTPLAGLRSRGTPEPGTSRPLRVQATDEATMGFLAPPQFLEDFDYLRPEKASKEEKTLVFDVPGEVPGMAESPAFSGFAMWTRVVVDEERVLEVRGQPDSHWAYVVTLMSKEPVRLAAPGAISLRSSVDRDASPVRYTLEAGVPC